MNAHRGYTLLETLIALTIVGIFFTVIVIILRQIIDNLGHARVRTTALSLAQSKMEIIRNLPYDEVGTQGGIPQGPIQPIEEIIINSISFTVTTSIIYIDDPYDGLTSTDLINTDYKRVRVEISWEGAFPSRSPLTLVTTIVPKGIESVVGGGTITIQAFNSVGEPVSNASVTITNQTVNPAINMSTLTDHTGIVILPGAPACNECYQITVTKPNFSTDRTYGTQEVVNPISPHATVLEGQLTHVSFAIDEKSSVTVKSYGSRETGYPPVANVFFTLRGGKIIGYDTQDEPVYKYVYTTNTGGGSVSIPDLEWDTYELDFTNSSHNLAGSNPIVPLAVIPKSSPVISIVAVPKTTHSVLIATINPQQQLLASVSAELTNTALQYSNQKTTGATGSADFGQVFFGGLTETTYKLTLDLSGYQETTSSLSVSGPVQQTFILNPQ
ncbi:prepilin-type N-terminal cleavage/methylation domain-containing protein [Candidatus Gottesmanbacteria bacterium]|nr:prepilin-type N-terminal cleavage/methylation domain-containing protein [Candidatus Gottesmanbacteria bacterium]